MSTVLILEHNENITGLIPKIVEEYVKSPRYSSTYQNKVREDSRKLKSDHRTFGLACTPLDPPSQYLKKNTRVEPQRTNVKHVHPKRPGYQRDLPSWVPIKRVVKDKLCDLPPDPVTLGSKNFRKQNIINAKLSRPRQPRKRYVDTRNGSAHDLEPSGLVPIYIFSKDYGKPPKFILKYRRSEEKKSEGKTVNTDSYVQPLCRYVTADERANLLYGMKKKWNEMTKQFQCLPFLTDTPPKVKRKSKLEEDLLQLERDIKVIESHPYIYVYSDTDDDKN